MKNIQFKSSVLLGLLLSFSHYVEANTDIFFSNPSYECMQSLHQINRHTFIIKETHNLFEGSYCSTNNKETKFECTGDGTIYCQSLRNSQINFTYFRGLQINYNNGHDTLVFRAAPRLYKAPFIFKSNPITDVGLSNDCSIVAEKIANKLISKCSEYTSNCKVSTLNHEGLFKSPIYCRPRVTVKGDSLKISR